MISPKFGCVALLDALGQRTANIEQANAYLDALGDIDTVMEEFSRGGDDVPGRVVPEHPGGDFGIRFFGDSILITLPFEAAHLNWVPVARMFAGASATVAVGLSRGILFRGAIAIGQYIETDHAVLGPAVLDCAEWFEMPDMFGVIATPNALFSIQIVLGDKADQDEGQPQWPVGAREAMGVPYSVPLKNGAHLETHVADWTFSARVRSREASTNLETWFFNVLRNSLVSPGVESKYRNSLGFLRHCDQSWKGRCRTLGHGA